MSIDVFPSRVTTDATVASTSNLLTGDGAGSANDSGIAAADLVLKQTGFATPTTLNEAIACLQAAGLCASIIFFLSIASATAADFGDIPANLTMTAGESVRRNAGDTLFESFTPGAGSVAWGSITGTLSDQTDLQGELDLKLDLNVAITGATKTKITYDANGLVTAGADATTADVADSLNKRYVTDAQLVIIGNTSGTNTGDQNLSGYVPTTTTVNSHALSGNVTVTPTDLSLVIGTNVQAWDTDLDTWATKTPYAGAVVVTTGKTFTNSNTLTLTATDGSTLAIGAGGTLGTNAYTSTAYVPTTTTVNSHALSGNVTVTPADLSLVIGTNTEAWDADLDTWATLTPSANFQTMVPHTFSQMRTDLSLVIGTNVEAWDADLDSWAGITRASGFDTFTATSSSANLKALLTDETGSGGAVVFATAPTTSNEIVGTQTAADNSTKAASTAYADALVSDTAFASSWNGVTAIANSKNAVYDWGHTFDTDDDGKVNVLDAASGTQQALIAVDANGVLVVGAKIRASGSSTSGTPGTSVASITAGGGNQLVCINGVAGHTNTASTQLTVTITYSDATTTTDATGAASAVISFINDAAILRSVSGAAASTLVAHSAKKITGIAVTTLGTGTGTRMSSLSAVEVPQ